MTLLRALVVDDEEDIRARLAQQLSRIEGIDEVVEASTAAQALASVRRASVALVLLDLGLRDRDGLDLLPELLAADPETRVICLTGRDEARVAVRALQSGAIAYLVKPWHKDELAIIVRRVVHEAGLTRQAELARRNAGRGPSIAGTSPGWRRVLELAKDAAGSRGATVLIRGESGTGKEVVASLIHRESARRDGPYVTTNVASIPAGLVEAEFFGHEPGAFTGASARRRGLFELAHGGTLFLDEIGEMPLEIQARLLRVLERQPFRRVGGEREVVSDVRVVCATHRDLEALVAAGQFRADLFYRLKVFEIGLPPLRERAEDIPALAEHFLCRLSIDSGDPRLELSAEALEKLVAYSWPGNARELRNVIERAAVLARGRPIDPRHLPVEIAGAERVRPSTPPPSAALPEDLSLEAAIRRHVELVFERCDRNLSRAARALDVSRVALRRRLRDYGLTSSQDLVTIDPVVRNEPAASAHDAGHDRSTRPSQTSL